MARLIEPDTEDLTGAFMVDGDLDVVDDTPEDAAARAVYAALVADAGRPKAVKHWKGVIKGKLGVKALHDKRLFAVLERGKALGLFEIDDSRKYNVLKPMEQKAPEPEPEIEEEPPPLKKQDWKSRPKAQLNPDSHPPKMLACGHLNWYSAEANEEAKAAGHCCQGGKLKTQPHWCYVTDRPIPKSEHRTEERVAKGGWAGLCVDAKGYYIGGVGNDCRYYRPKGTKICAYHSPCKKRSKE